MHDQSTLQALPGSPPEPQAGTVVEQWTGWKARALRLALRMTYVEFAKYLGVGERTVAYWCARPEAVPVPELQRALDTALALAEVPAQSRFALALAAGEAA
jgi:transcriptional regulator with XRE-family HTH domain